MSVPTGFNTWIAWILLDEGPEVNDSPDEPGGISKYGVSLTSYSDFCRATALPWPPTKDDVANLTEYQAANFYSWFFSSMNLDQFDAQLAYRLADIVTSLGRVGCIECLQMCLAIWPLTGIMDAPTITAVKNVEPTVLIFQLDAAWLVWKYRQGGWPTYGHGWTNRILKVRARLPSLVGVTS